MKGNFIGIGVQKSASTWVYRVLEDHPEVVVSVPKELDYFSYNYAKGSDWYQKHFKGLGVDAQAKIVGEVSPSYFEDPDAPKRAFEYNPGFKVVLTLRDPVERAFSNHLHQIRITDSVNLHNDLSFETWVKDNPEYIERSMYIQHLSKWMSFFPESQILILLQEDIKENPAREAQKVYEFLGIDTSHESLFLNRKANVSYSEKVRGIDAGLKFLARIARKFGLDSFIDKVKKTDFIHKLREKNRGHLSDIVPPMKDETKDNLYSGFSTGLLDIAKLMRRNKLPWKTWEYAKSNGLLR